MASDRASLTNAINDLHGLQVLDALEELPDRLYKENKKRLSQYYHDNSR